MLYIYFLSAALLSQLSFVSGTQLLCTVLLIKPGAWTRNLARILRKLDLEKFSFVGMKNVTLKPDIIIGLLSPEAKQVC